jgi:hypothetical protein
MTRRRRALAGGIALGAAAVVAGLTACGGAHPALTSEAAKQLDAQVQSVRAAVDRGDTGGARQALVELRTMVGVFEQAAQLSASRATQILATVASLEAALPTTTTTTATITTTATTVLLPAPSDAGAHHHDGKRNQGD